MLTYSKQTLLRHIKTFEKAVEERAFIGAKHPGEHAGIEKNYAYSKDALINYVEARISKER